MPRLTVEELHRRALATGAKVTIGGRVLNADMERDDSSMTPRQPQRDQQPTAPRRDEELLALARAILESARSTDEAIRMFADLFAQRQSAPVPTATPKSRGPWRFEFDYDADGNIRSATAIPFD